MVIAKVVELFVLAPSGSEEVIFSDKPPAFGVATPKHANVQLNLRSRKPGLDHEDDEGCGGISNLDSSNRF